MGRIGGAAPHPKNEQASATLPHLREFVRNVLDGFGVKLRGNLLNFLKKLLGKGHKIQLNVRGISWLAQGKPVESSRPLF
jgi:hypothetical protein